MAKGREEKHIKPRFYVTLFICIVLMGIAFAAYHDITIFASLEYNRDPLLPTIFTKREAEFMGEYDRLRTEKGRHLLIIKPKGCLFGLPVFLTVSDTTAPCAQANPPITILLGETVTPDQLISNIQDNDIVQIYYETETDFSTVGLHKVRVIIEDMSGNKTVLDCDYSIRGVIDGVTIEAGSPLPEADSYLACDPSVTNPKLVSEYGDALTHHVGKYDVVFSFQMDEAHQEDVSCLTVVDTVAPSGRGVCLITEPGQEITPRSFVEDAYDETDISFEYVIAPDLDVHEMQTVLVRMTDEGGNATDVRSSLIASTIPSKTIEARAGELTPKDFGLTGNVKVEHFEPSAIGLYLVKVWINDKEEGAVIRIVDTTAPKLSIRDVGTMYVNHPLQPEELFDAEDVFDVSIKYMKEPNWAETGEQDVTVCAVDANGNRSELTETITIVEDKEPPVIYGVDNRDAYRGESIAYLAGVFAEDNADGKVDIAVTSEVINGVLGRYLVTYTATDICGNTTSKNCYYTIVEPTVTEEEVHALARSVIEEIITPEMVAAEKLNAVFYYVRNRVKYNGYSNKADWRQEVKRGITQGVGDCFTVYSVTRALLDELNIEYLSVRRQSSKTRHYWVIVNIGTGWYHFDPLYVSKFNFCCFMWTNRQCAVNPSWYFRFDHSKYPEIATEPFDYDAVVAAEKSGLLP